MLQYAKTILTQVSPWKGLFRKELIKSTEWMNEYERFECYKWCRIKYYHMYPDILEEVFQDIFNAIRFKKHNTVKLSKDRTHNLQSFPSNAS